MLVDSEEGQSSGKHSAELQIWTRLAKPDDSSDTGQAVMFQFKIAAVLYTLTSLCAQAALVVTEVNLALERWTDVSNF